MKALKSCIVAVALGLGLAVATPAHAQARVDTVEYTGPDRGLLHSGIWTLGLSYVPALVVGIESTLPEDRYLFAPVAGPWIDFAKRDCPTCNHERLNKVLLVTDGIVQGVGALEIVGSFLFVEHATVSRTASDDSDKPKSNFQLHVVPTRVAGAYGLAAIGKF
jgi:hypothetical protein